MSFSKMGYVFLKGRENTVWKPPYNAVPVTWQDWLDVRAWEASGLTIEEALRKYPIEQFNWMYFGDEE